MLFCDLVGSTAIAAQLDPEEWRETVGEYHRRAADAITRFGGHVVKYLGDGVMALFGWPAAHDNDAERAARAGLAIIDALAKFDELLRHAKLAARVGIDSGPVVVGQGAGGEVDVFGDAANIAARVETAAEPGTVLITAATQRLVPRDRSLCAASRRDASRRLAASRSPSCLWDSQCRGRPLHSDAVHITRRVRP